jgi:hypothetical protein
MQCDNGTILSSASLLGLLQYLPGPKVPGLLMAQIKRLAPSPALQLYGRRLCSVVREVA